MGCLLGSLGQELSGISDVFRRKIEECLTAIARQIADCLEGARTAGDIPPNSNPQKMANLLVDCWEGAALRSRLRHDPRCLTAMLDFYLSSVQGLPEVAPDLPADPKTAVTEALQSPPDCSAA